MVEVSGTAETGVIDAPTFTVLENDDLVDDHPLAGGVNVNTKS